MTDETPPAVTDAEAIAALENAVEQMRAAAHRDSEWTRDLALAEQGLSLARDGQRWREALAPAHPMACDCDDYRRPSIMCGYCGRPIAAEPVAPSTEVPGE